MIKYQFSHYNFPIHFVIQPIYYLFIIEPLSAMVEIIKKYSIYVNEVSDFKFMTRKTAKNAFFTKSITFLCNILQEIITIYHYLHQKQNLQNPTPPTSPIQIEKWSRKFRLNTTGPHGEITQRCNTELLVSPISFIQCLKATKKSTITF